ncbi:Ulp1 protease family, C-terminal catalytic domain containing protein [Trema orientale]|uniref:Ulp1 protease family, C-terminal catalytic domain containing protein n=1 Tax=Trema orientale TaxID=63057 RepID=A0A2P5FCI0_TREOI|nr:Ulp1 protease family, C-terminal catalytic domain containing protein [Trema orientale]
MGEAMMNYLLNSIRRLDNHCSTISNRIASFEMEVKASRDDIRRMEEDRRSFQNTILDMMLGCQQEEKLHTNVSMKNQVGSLCNENEKYSQKREVDAGDDIVNMETTAYKSPGCLKMNQSKETYLESIPSKMEFTNYDKREKLVVKPSTVDIDKNKRIWRGNSRDQATLSQDLLGVHINNKSVHKSECKIINFTGGGGYSSSNHVSKHNQQRQIPSITVKEKDPKFVSSKKAKLERGETSIRMSNNFPSVGLFNVGPFKLCNSIRDPIEAAVNCIVVTKHNSLPRGILYCLEPNQYLDGEVINVMAELLTESEKVTPNEKSRNWYLQTRMPMSKLDVILKDDIANTMPTDFSFSKFDMFTNPDIPQQKNNFDCGIYVINFMQETKFADLEEPKYKSADARVKLAIQIATSNLNLHFPTLKKKALQNYNSKFRLVSSNNAGFSSGGPKTQSIA